MQATNWTAIAIFAAFVLLTLAITAWAAGRTRTTRDFYAAGGGVTGFQNGLAIAGDYMSRPRSWASRRWSTAAAIMD